MDEAFEKVQEFISVRDGNLKARLISMIIGKYESEEKVEKDIHEVIDDLIDDGFFDREDFEDLVIATADCIKLYRSIRKLEED